MPIGAKPIVVPGRGPGLQPVGKGAAAAFADRDEEDKESGRRAGVAQPGFPLKSALPPVGRGAPPMPPIMAQLPVGLPPMIGLQSGIRPGLPLPRGVGPQPVAPVARPGLVPAGRLPFIPGMDPGRVPVPAPGITTGRAAFPPGRGPLEPVVGKTG